MSSPPAASPSSAGRLAPYRAALRALSARTGTPLPSLVVSFAVLHELTALVPLVGVFYASRALGVGESLVAAVAPCRPSNEFGSAEHADEDGGWIQARAAQWVDEGTRWAERVGRRYGAFGFEKRQPGVPSTASDAEVSAALSGRIAGDVANAVVAYGVTKALMPVRVGLSLWLSPAFSRRVVEPLRKGVLKRFQRAP